MIVVVEGKRLLGYSYISCIKAKATSLQLILIIKLLILHCLLSFMMTVFKLFESFNPWLTAFERTEYLLSTKEHKNEQQLQPNLSRDSSYIPFQLNKVLPVIRSLGNPFGLCVIGCIVYHDHGGYQRCFLKLKWNQKSFYVLKFDVKIF